MYSNTVLQLSMPSNALMYQILLNLYLNMTRIYEIRLASSDSSYSHCSKQGVLNVSFPLSPGLNF